MQSPDLIVWYTIALKTRKDASACDGWPVLDASRTAVLKSLTSDSQTEEQVVQALPDAIDFDDALAKESIVAWRRLLTIQSGREA